MEELKLEEIKNNILKNAKDKNIISDHTSIDVRTKVANATDAAGKKITNYEVAVSYTVDEAFSSRMISLLVSSSVRIQRLHRLCWLW